VKMHIRLGLLASLVFFSSAGASAREQLGERDPVVVDPQKAYIFFRTPERLNLRLLREVDAAERAAWEADRERAFTRARDRTQRRIAEWDREAPNCRGNAAVTPQCQMMGDRPVPVTNENFAFAPPEQDNFIDVTRGREFERTASGYTYFRAVDPGTYIVYGPMIETPQAILGVCLCMGSVRFDARPGQIVDLGELRLEPEASAGPAEGRFVGDGRLPSPTIVPAGPGVALPARLAGLPVTPAEFRAADRMPNYFGILIDRLGPMPGVLAYEQGRVIDLHGQAGAAQSASSE
jgi:hypothetical protein